MKAGYSKLSCFAVSHNCEKFLDGVGRVDLLIKELNGLMGKIVIGCNAPQCSGLNNSCVLLVFEYTTSPDERVQSLLHN